MPHPFHDAQDVKPKRYERQTRGGEECLAEYRADSPYPFRAPKAAFDALVEVLVGGDRPFGFGKLRSAISARLDETPAEYQLRVCLRLLSARGLIRARRRT